jgi:LacI family repressor for deo operon, udp, cdd, tsx, nupC, and nupG
MSIQHVASQAGVSIATVSRVFNSPQIVARDTRDRVRACAEALGYSPNVSARTLRTRRSRTLGVVLPTLLNPVFAECLEGIAARAHQSGYAIVPLFSHYQLTQEADAIGQLLAHTVDGVILTVASAGRSASLARLQDHALPYVLAYNRHPGQPCVSVDGEAACAEVVAWLAGLGHRRIAMVSGTLNASDRARQRYRGFQRAADSRPSIRSELIEVPFMHAAQAALADRLVRPDRPSALVCSNDLLAVRCLRAAALAGLRVPQDLSVVGFDGIALGEDLSPQLSTVVQPNREIGQTCVDWLVAALHDRVPPSARDSHSLAYGIRAGESCARPAPARARARRGAGDPHSTRPEPASPT